VAEDAALGALDKVGRMCYSIGAGGN
jgi:hypothetical protein